MMEFISTAVEFSKKYIGKAMKFWNGLDDDKKKLLTGCIVAAVSVIVIASIAYSMGRNRGRRYIHR